MKRAHSALLIIAVVLLSGLFSGCQRTALDLFKENVRKNPNSPKAHNDLAFQYYQLKKYDDAIKEYQKALEIRPGDFLARNNIAQIYYETGRYQQALDLFNELLPKNEKNSLLHNNIGMCFHQMKKYPEAYFEYKKALELNPNNKYSIDGMKVLKLDMKKAGLAFPPAADKGAAGAQPPVVPAPAPAAKEKAK